MLRATKESSMAAGTKTWQRRMIATGVIGAGILTPLISMTPASAASLCAPPADTVPPQVTGLTVSTQTVDLNSGSRTVTITADASDTSGNGAASGVKSIFVFLRGAREFNNAKLTLASGTAASGTWTGTFTVPKTGRAGTLSVESVEAQDAAHNFQDYSMYGKTPQSPTDVSLQAGWDTSITITGTPPAPPKRVAAGKLTSFGFTPAAVNSTAAVRKVHVTAAFSSPQPSRAGVDFVTVSGRGREFDGKITHASGDQWTGTVRIPRWVGDINLRAQLFAGYPAKDAPRFRNVNADQLELRHFPTKLAVTSGVDKTPPVLKTLSFSPSSVNTTTGKQTVTVTATASDALSGVRNVNVNLNINRAEEASAGASAPATGFYPYAGIGYEQNGFANFPLKLVGGNWVGTATFRECVPSGDWHVTANLGDRAGNNAYYSPKKLVAAGLPGSLTVTSTAGDVEPPEVRDATASGADHTITLDFTEGVKNVTTSTLSVYAVKPAATRYQSTSAVTAMTCSNGTTTVDCSGSGGLVTSAVLTVPTLVGGAVYQVYANLGAITSQLTDGTGNPLSWNGSVAQVTGS
jgi:hypothetical protein